MATPAQIEANRVNSQSSTGPNSEAGKAVSSQNAFKHGLYSQRICTPSENPAELDALKADLIAEHQPAGSTEAILVNEMAEHVWRIRRAREYEAVVLGSGFDLARLAAVQRMMSSAERGFHKALKALQELRKASSGGADARAQRLVRGSQAQTAAPATPNGFVPQKQQLAPEQTLTATHPHTGFVPQKQPAAQSKPEIGFESQNASLALDALVLPAALPHPDPTLRFGTDAASPKNRRTAACEF